MTADHRQARKYFDGVLMAYQDCAEIAEALADKQDAFAHNAPERQMIAAGAETMARQLASSFRAKLAAVKEMIASAPPTSGDVQ